jgi:hypothetical protein
MFDNLKKWYYRTWSNWEFEYETIWSYHESIILKRTSNDGLIEYKKIRKK